MSTTESPFYIRNVEYQKGTTEMMVVATKKQNPDKVLTWHKPL